MSEGNTGKSWIETPAGRYVVAQTPGWLIGAAVAWALWRWTAVPGWAAAALFAVWVLKDFALYPRMKRYYRSEPVDARVVGRSGKAVTNLAPTGFVRIHGELWQAELAPGAGSIKEGDNLRVLAVDGLLLIVEPEPSAGNLR